MINTFTISGQEQIAETVTVLRSAAEVPRRLESEVGAIIEEVGRRGDKALLEYSRRFDGVEIEARDLEIPEDERQAAWESLGPDTRTALGNAAARIRRFAEMSLKEPWTDEPSPGVTVGEAFRALSPAGIYVPGGRYAYPSTVLMTALPASAAGVEEIVICTPTAPGSADSAVAATVLVGECRVFRTGGAQAVAAMALGTETVPRCRMIAGPGNVYVTAAKRMLASMVKIDLEAGPSEVALVVDGTADPRVTAADMMAQLEHDPLSIAVTVTASEDAARATRDALAAMLEEAGVVEGSGASVVTCSGMDQVIDFVNELAPEHLVLALEGADELLERIESAGCVFVGRYSAVAFGDYVAGPSHVLPTGGAAARMSGLSARDFRRAMNVVRYESKGFEADAPSAELIARLEGLEMHARSLEERKETDG